MNLSRVKTLVYINHKITHYYKLIKVIGSGTYGKVYEAQHLKSGLLCAIKVIMKKQIEGKTSLICYLE